MRGTECRCGQRCPSLFPVFTGGAEFAARPQPLLRRPSSSQTPHSSPRRKRQVSSVPLLVLSKLQTLRWFAIWFRLSCQKKWAKRGAGSGSDCTAVPQNEPMEEHCGQHTINCLQNWTTAPPAWKQRSHRKQLPRKEMAKHAAVEYRTHLRIRRWCRIFLFHCKSLQGANDSVRPVRFL